MNLKVIVILLGIAFVLAGCAKNGDQGSQGAAGVAGPPGQTITPPPVESVAQPTCDKDFAEGYDQGYNAANAKACDVLPAFSEGYSAGYEQAVDLCKEHIKKIKEKHDNH